MFQYLYYFYPVIFYIFHNIHESLEKRCANLSFYLHRAYNHKILVYLAYLLMVGNLLELVL